MTTPAPQPPAPVGGIPRGVGPATQHTATHQTATHRTATHRPPPTRPPLARPVQGRWLAGVCAGVAAHLGVPVAQVRLVMALLLVTGPGLPVYLFLWALAPQQLTPDLPPGDPRATRVAAAVVGGPWAAVVAVGGLVVLVGAAVGLQQAGIDVRAPVLVPLLVIAAGAIVAWSNLDEAGRDDWLGSGAAGRAHGWIRVALGLGLVVVGILVLALRRQPLSAVWDALLATAAVLCGAVIVAAPWVVRLWRGMRREQVAAARATERADIAAHLHDSVLQTLTLIQRRAGDPVAVAQLARAQERELRAWLYAPPPGQEQTLAAAVTAAAHEVEDLHGVPVELVVTGDRVLEPHGAALVRALREALLNAVRHGAPPVTAYVEIGREGVEAFVRDRGSGFDLEAVPADRLGLRQSVLGRMARHGGTARVRRREDGTEVELALPPLPATAEAPASPAAAPPAAPTPERASHGNR